MIHLTAEVIEKLKEFNEAIGQPELRDMFKPGPMYFGIPKKGKEMEKELQDFLKEKIYNYLQNDVEFEGNEMHDYKEVEWLWGEKTVIVDLEIYGYNKHDWGDYYNPPTDSGKIEADVDCVVVVDEDNVTEYRDTKELSTTYEY